MPQPTFPRDRFDDVPHDPARVGAHRAPRPKMRWLVVVLWWLLAVAVLTGAGIVAFLALSNTNMIDLPAPPTSSQGPAEEEAVVDTDYVVLVLNGTGDAAAAEAVAAGVREAGWGEDDVVELDADSDDFEATTIFYVNDGDAAAARGLAAELGVENVAQSGDFAEMSENGLTVVVGLDRVDAP
ncbi:LytR C-terminal domain-containing protein [Microbacterium karelineae]|uniref:LytR C-terminal domain-containing protein n=1 Tax=Microbacterium karelineae TaxID=2654283 RepID=UPI0018D3A663|nr:LytR C-terminal domain-containing protein [Microbacterium karelineae]